MEGEQSRPTVSGSAAGEQSDGNPVTVVVAHRSRIVTDGLVALLHDTPGIEIRHATCELPTFPVGADTPDVLVLDPDLTTDEGASVGELSRKNPDMRILLIADPRDAQRNIRLIGDGAIGLVDATSGAVAVAHAIQVVARGLGVAPARYVRLAATRLTNAFEDRFDGLTEDELALWRDVADGLDYGTIAERHFVSDRTARRHVDALLERLGVENRLQAAELAGRVFLRDRDLASDDES